MAFGDSIKEFFGKRFLAKEIAMRNPDKELSQFNFADAKSVGILFDSSDKEEFELVKRYVSYLKEMKKRVKVIGYFSAKNIPQLNYSKLEYDFFTKKELNWQQKPSDPFIDNFIDEEYDVLIDLNIYDRFPLRYIAVVCKAKFKIGTYHAKYQPVYDMMIEMEQGKSLKYLLRQVDTYLFMINNKDQNNTNPVNY